MNQRRAASIAEAGTRNGISASQGSGPGSSDEVVSKNLKTPLSDSLSPELPAPDTRTSNETPAYPRPKSKASKSPHQVGNTQY